MKLAFLGTGVMGHPMAGRLMQEGHKLTVCNRTREKAEPLRQAGATVAESAKQTEDALSQGLSGQDYSALCSAVDRPDR